ncbi:hypothetical protein [Kitasatospora purpeofusca]|uniref:hypothetical protein n=1 Tax=Kitasatospora purpeofusca TaxID=67352 RepID=UPI002A59E9CC|nr:hypothetical protein [Kitasatospora purpeofusca]MDY0812049.1 hypothetical protein [Kitasatospora purpeofusca]
MLSMSEVLATTTSVPRESKGRRRHWPVWAVPVVAVLLAGTVSCAGEGSGGNGQAPADKGGPTTSGQAPSATTEQKSLDMRGLVALVSGNLTELVVFDETTGRTKAGAFLPQYAVPSAWRRQAFSPDWRSVVWTTKAGELFFGEYTSGAGPNGNYGETPVSIGAKPTYTGGKPSYTQPRFGPDGKRVYFLANNDKVYSADPTGPDNLKEEATLETGTFSQGNGLAWDIAVSGQVEKRQAVSPERKSEATAPDGKRTVIENRSGWFLKESGSTAEPKFLFEHLLDYDEKPLTDKGMTVDVLGWY